MPLALLIVSSPILFLLLISSPLSLTAQLIKIKVFPANLSEVDINKTIGGLTVETSGTLSNLNGLTYLDTYKISDVFNRENAVALKPNAMGVIGESSMFVDEYEITATNITILNAENCTEFFNDLNEGDYFGFDRTLKYTTAFFGIHKKKWLVLLPRGYRFNEQVTGYGTIYANNTAFSKGNVTVQSLVGRQLGPCGIRWTADSGPAQTILVDFGNGAVLDNEPLKHQTTNCTTPNTAAIASDVKAQASGATNVGLSICSLLFWLFYLCCVLCDTL